MAEKIILTDCDGVLLDWEQSFNSWMKIQGYVAKTNSVNYDISYKYEISKEQGVQLVRQFNASSWIKFLPAYKDSRSGVARLREAGYRFHCITSLSLDPCAKKLRKSNLKNIFGQNAIQELVCLDTGADKDQELSKWKNSELYWIEDKAENALLGAQMGLKSLLLTHNHNKFFKNDQVVRVANWAEITNIIISN